MTDIVLVHGTTQTAAGFTALVNELASYGHRAHTVDVPSGTDATARQHADLLAAQLPDDLNRPVVLAHSASGLLLPALARRLHARHQIWLTAAVPDFTGRRPFLTELRSDPIRSECSSPPGRESTPPPTRSSRPTSSSTTRTCRHCAPP